MPEKKHQVIRKAAPEKEMVDQNPDLECVSQRRPHTMSKSARWKQLPCKVLDLSDKESYKMLLARDKKPTILKVVNLNLEAPQNQIQEKWE